MLDVDAVRRYSSWWADGVAVEVVREIKIEPAKSTIDLVKWRVWYHEKELE